LKFPRAKHDKGKYFCFVYNLTCKQNQRNGMNEPNDVTRVDISSSYGDMRYGDLSTKKSDKIHVYFAMKKIDLQTAGVSSYKLEIEP